MTETPGPKRLTPGQKRRGQRSFFTFTALNALSYAALAESVLVLYALKMQASDFQVGLLTGYIHLTTVFMLLGKWLITRWGAARTYGYAWMVRNLTAVLFLFAPLIWTRWSQEMGLFWLLGSSFLFFSFRSTGTAAHNVLINDVAGDADRGHFISRMFMFANLSMMLMLTAVSFWLGREPSFARFQAVIAFGCLMGVAASVFLFRVPESGGPRLSSREPLYSTLEQLYREKPLQLLFVAWVLTAAAVQLLIPFQILAVKNGYRFTDQQALIFVVVQMSGTITAAYLNSLLVDRAGPRPVLVLSVLGLALISLCWFLSPHRINYFYTGTLFFLAGYGLVSTQITLSQYFFNIARKESVLNLSLLVTVLYGLGAGLVGAFVGGGLLVVLRRVGFTGIELYRIYFLFVLAAQLLALPAVLRLVPLKEWKITDVLGTMFSLRDWRALHSVQRLAELPDLGQAHKQLDELSILRSDLSEETLLEYLDSPLFTIRSAALEALDKIDFGPRAAGRLIRELGRSEFTTGYLVAEILGKHRIEEAVPALRESLKSSDYFLEGKAMLALSQLGDGQSYPRIVEIFSLTYNPRLLIHGARALYHIGSLEHVPLMLKKLDVCPVPGVQDEIMHAALALLGFAEENFRLMTLYNRDPGQGEDALRDEVEKRLQQAAGKLSRQDRLLVEKTLAGLGRRPGASPAGLVGLLRALAGDTGGKCSCVLPLLEQDARLAAGASTRLRFSMTVMGVLLYLERLAKGNR
ncbi:MAG: MFS transporter [Candidatus Glassbacteria bacterium]|nr:MFS transporter [Candidatus Glassbacteria bacterium]